MLLALVALAACAATLIGGSFALRFRDKLHLILGFSAGAVVGVALFDLLPESIDLSGPFHTPATLTLFVALGFLAYLVIDRTIFLHAHESDGEGEAMPRRGAFGASTLSAHSFLDGVAIGIGFQASSTVGIIVAVAVLTHDFSDGINTVNMVLRNGGTWKQAFRWLLIDALAPVVGIAATLFVRISDSAIGLVLAVFVGTFLYLGAADLIPESHHRHPRFATTFMTVFGAAVLYAAVTIAQ